MSFSVNNNNVLITNLLRTQDNITNLNSEVSSLSFQEEKNYNRTTNCYVPLLWNEYLQLWLSNVKPSTVLDSGNNPDLPPTRTSRFFYLFQMFYYQMYLTLIKGSSKNIFPSWFTYSLSKPLFSDNMNNILMYGLFYLMIKINNAVVNGAENIAYNEKEITDFFNSCKSGTISPSANTWIQSQVNLYWGQMNLDYSGTGTNPTWPSAYVSPIPTGGNSTSSSIPSGTWRPVEVPNGTFINSDWDIPWADLSNTSTYKTQSYATPNWGGVKGYDWYRGPGGTFPSQIQTSLNTYSPGLTGAALEGYMQQVKEIGSTLTPREKFISEFWEDGYGTAKPCGKWNFLTRLIIRSLGMSEEQCLELLFLVNASLVNAFIVAWDVKRIYEAERPVTFIRRNSVSTFNGWRGNNVKGGVINPDATHNFLPYQSPTFITPPFPGFISGHSTCSAAAATTISQYIGSNIVPNIMVPVPTNFNKDSSMEVLNEIRSNFPPYLEYDTSNYTRVFLSFKTFDDMIESAGWSRLYGGIHILPDHTAAVEIGKYLAEYTLNAYKNK